MTFTIRLDARTIPLTANIADTIALLTGGTQTEQVSVFERWHCIHRSFDGYCFSHYTSGESQGVVRDMSGPKFKNPPVVERVLSVQFQELHPFDVIHFGIWYQLIKDRYPTFERQKPTERVSEPYPFVPRHNRIAFGLEIVPALPRMVFSTAEPKRELLQLQSDRFIMNWAREANGGDEDYVEYTKIREQFSNLFGELVQFCREHQITEPIIDLCEVTYVNQIQTLEGMTALESFPKIINTVVPQEGASWMQGPVALTYNRVFDVVGDRGRVYFESGAPSLETKEGIALKITARANVDADHSWIDRMDAAHLWVVKGFEAVTSQQVREKIWEQSQ